ncbi:transposon Tf2-9 polyprotein [Trichonephila clavipes]|uniref:Transposon Tf2-9 polyprotein n=1 Tax=Trichonephila clavipes TaxID=2585209 RepID=A0A8X6SFP0_TRICX|nr:transposon Tf2-9 polyprotein [Trichonephila clavipes]
MAEVTAVKIPPYNFSDPQLWFSTCERTFTLGVPKAITDTCTKFNYIVSNLPPEATAIQLPSSVQTILASITPIAVEKAAEVADRILEESTSNVSLSTNAIASSSEKHILQEIERLNKRIDDLTMHQRTPERRNNSRPRNRSRNLSFSRSRESGFCWYHRKFQERTKKCNSHPAAIEKTNPARSNCDYLLAAAYFTSPFH